MTDERLQYATFSRRLLTMHPVERSIVRVVTYSSFILCVGLAVAFLISDIRRLVWAGTLLVFFLLDIVFHSNRSHFSLSEFVRGKVPQNNIALCLDRRATHLFTSAYDAAFLRKTDLDLEIFLRLMNERAVVTAFERLEINVAECKERLSVEIDRSAQADQVIVKEAYINRIKQICLGAASRAMRHGIETIRTDSVCAALATLNSPGIMRLLDFYSVVAEDIDGALVFGSNSKRRAVPYLGGFAMRNARAATHRVNRSFTSRPTPTLDKYALDVTDYVRDGYGGFLIGHEREFDSMLDALSRSGEHNVLLVGDPGVGKEALVYHLAYRIVIDAVPKTLFDRRVVQISLADMLAGSTKEEMTGRLKKISEEILRAGNVALYIPDAHLLEKGSREGEISLGDVFAPILKSGLFPVVATTSPKEYTQFIDSRPTLADTFEVIRMQELSQQDAIRLLAYSALILEKKYRITITFSAVKKAVIYAAKYMHFKPLPSSAQELLQETVADGAQRGEKHIRGEHVTTIIERKIHMPVQLAAGIEAKQLLKLEETIHSAYIDQDEAVSAVARALRAHRSGLGRKDGPIASFLFVGPTGVGKTELTKILAKLYFGAESFMLRFDMSEYQEKESVVRFIGSSDGKVAGQLTEAVLHQPYSIILLDEFEKAHPDILNLFLQVFDDGRLTDSSGRTVDFRNAIIISTSNAHSVLVQQYVQEHSSIDGLAEELKGKLSEYFKPELINRFSDIIIFKPLSREDLEKIVELLLGSLQKTVQETHAITIIFSQPAKEKIAHIGYDPAFGARPLRKAIDMNVTSVLSEKILAGQIHKGDSIEVTLDSSGKFIFTT